MAQQQPQQAEHGHQAVGNALLIGAGLSVHEHHLIRTATAGS